MRARVSARSIAVTLLVGAFAGGAALAGSIPRCKKSLASVVVLEPDVDWWSELGLGSPGRLLEAFVDESGCFTRFTRAADLDAKADFSLLPDAAGPPDRDLGPPRGAPGTDGVGGGGGVDGRGVEGGGANSDGQNGAPTVTGKLVGPRNVAMVLLTLTDQRSARSPLRTRAMTHASSGTSSPIFIPTLGPSGNSGYIETPRGRSIAAAYLEAYRSLVRTIEREAAKEPRPKN
jgi:hypothetical protein